MFATQHGAAGEVQSAFWRHATHALPLQNGNAPLQGAHAAPQWVASLQGRQAFVIGSQVVPAAHPVTSQPGGLVSLAASEAASLSDAASIPLSGDASDPPPCVSLQRPSTQ